MNDYPLWATETDAPGSEIELANWYLEIARNKIFAKIISSVISSNDASGLRRLNAEIKSWVIERVKTGKEQHERSLFFLLDDANRTGWYQDLNEMDSIEELLASKLEGLDDGSEYSDYAYMLKTSVPIIRQAAENKGTPPENLTGLITSASKSRVFVPLCRDLIPTNGAALSDVNESTLLKYAEMVTDPTISVMTFREEVSKARGKFRGAPEPASVDKYDISGETWVLIRTTNDVQRRAIEMAIKRVTQEPNQRDPISLAKELGDKLFKTDMLSR